MSLTKVPYVDGVTVISGENLNAIQDAIIALEGHAIQISGSPIDGQIPVYSGTSGGWVLTALFNAETEAL